MPIDLNKTKQNKTKPKIKQNETTTVDYVHTPLIANYVYHSTRVHIIQNQ